MENIVNHCFELTLNGFGITNWFNIYKEKNVSKLWKPLTSTNYKVYAIVSNNTILYVGTTKDNIRNRLRSGLKANGKNGYHGYKWKDRKKVRIYVWCFDNLNKEEIENIEAEFALIVRNSTSRWPECQNEIHFNNSFFPEGKDIATVLFNQISEMDK